METKEILILIASAFGLLLFWRYSFRKGLIKGLTSSASDIGIAKRHNLFRKGRYWKIVDIYSKKAIGSEKYFVFEALDSSYSLSVAWSNILPAKDKEQSLQIGYTYELTICKDYNFPFNKPKEFRGNYIRAIVK